MNHLEEKARRKKRAALWWMTGFGLLTIIIFGYCSDSHLFRLCVEALSRHRLLECDSSNPCVVSHWRSWEMGAVIWSMLFGIYYYVTFTSPDHGSDKLICLIVIVGAEGPNVLAGYFILFRQGIEWHVAAILLSTFAFLWADASLYRKHPDGSDQKGVFFESLLLADAPIVVGSIALLIDLWLHGRFSLDASHSQDLDAFTGGAISFQLIASNVIFVVTQGDFLSTFWKKHREVLEERKGGSAADRVEEGIVSGGGGSAAVNEAEPADSRGLSPQQSVRASGRVRLMSGLLALIMLTALAMFIFVPGKSAIRELIPVPEIESGSGRVTALALSADGETLARGSSEGSIIRVLAVQGRKRKPESAFLEDEAVVHALAFSPDGRTLASAGKGSNVRLWDTKTGVERGTLEVDEDSSGGQTDLLCLEFSSAGDLLAAGTESGAIKLWDLERGRKWTLPLTGSEEGARHKGEVRALAFSVDGRWLVSGGKGKKIILWNIEALLHGERMEGQVFRGPTDTNALVISVALSSDGNLLAAGTQDARVWLWDRTIDKVRSEPKFRPMHEHKGAVLALRFSDDASLLASVSESPGLIFWETQSDKRRLPVRAQSNSPTAMTFARNAWILASASSDGTLRVWRGK